MKAVKPKPKAEAEAMAIRARTDPRKRRSFLWRKSKIGPAENGRIEREAYDELCRHPISPFRMIEGVLYVTLFDDLEVVPADEGEERVHAAILSGQLLGMGIETAYKTLGAHYWGITRRMVREALSKEEVSQLHKRYPRPRTGFAILPTAAHERWEADLIFFPTNMAHENKGAVSALTCIDVFSKRAWAVPLVHKDADSVAHALEEVFHDQKPHSLQTDLGSEFHGAFDTLLTREGIKHIWATVATSTTQGAIERFNQTLKKKLYAWMDQHSSWRWTEFLPTALSFYNTQPHQTLGISPNEAEEDGKKEYVYNCLLHAGWKNTRQSRAVATALGGPLAKGDIVRLRIIEATPALHKFAHKLERHLKKAFLALWTKRKYEITEVRKTTLIGSLTSIPAYRVVGVVDRKDPWAGYQKKEAYRRFFDRRDLLLVPEGTHDVLPGPHPAPLTFAGDETLRVTKGELTKLRAALSHDLPAEEVEEALALLKEEVPLGETVDVRDETPPLPIPATGIRPKRTRKAPQKPYDAYL